MEITIYMPGRKKSALRIVSDIKLFSLWSLLKSYPYIGVHIIMM